MERIACVHYSHVMPASAGLGNLGVIGGALTIYVDYTPNAIPGPLAPFFLPALREVNGLVIKECADCNTNPNVPPVNPARALRGLPGLAGVFRIAPPANPRAASSLFITGTGFVDASSFAGLTCSPGFVSIGGNPVLTSLQGFQNLRPASSPGPQWIITDSALKGNVSIASLTGMADCETLPLISSPAKDLVTLLLTTSLTTPINLEVPPCRLSVRVLAPLAVG
jgi:hypothetical protein